MRGASGIAGSVKKTSRPLRNVRRFDAVSLGIRLTPDLDAPPDWCSASGLQPYDCWLAVRFPPVTEERPVPSVMMAPVFLLTPAGALGRVFPARPLPKTDEDSVDLRG